MPGVGVQVPARTVPRVGDPQPQHVVVGGQAVGGPHGLGRVGQLPGPDPDPTELPPLGDFRVIRFEKGGPLDLIVSSPEDQPVLARLFDATGVLLGESEGLDEETAGETPAPAGMVPHTRLKVDGLEAGGTYLLQVVHRERDAGRQQTRLGFDEVPR